MNYQRIYDSIIGRAIERQLSGDTYTEKHHIIPRYMGGTNNKSNIVRLTAEEHYVCHQLLVKIYPFEWKLIYAVNLMGKGPGQMKRNNKSFGWIRRRMGEESSRRLTGKPRSTESIEKQRNTMTGRVYSQARKDAISKGNSKPKATIECPHCKLIGGIGNMKRYHFDFCKTIGDALG